MGVGKCEPAGGEGSERGHGGGVRVQEGGLEGDGLAERLRAASPSGRIDAFLDFYGGGYVELAVDELGVAPRRVDTIADFPAVSKFGVQAAGNADAANAAVLAELADFVAFIDDGAGVQYRKLVCVCCCLLCLPCWWCSFGWASMSPPSGSISKRSVVRQGAASGEALEWLSKAEFPIE